MMSLTAFGSDRGGSAEGVRGTPNPALVRGRGPDRARDRQGAGSVLVPPLLASHLFRGQPGQPGASSATPQCSKRLPIQTEARAGVAQESSHSPWHRTQLAPCSLVVVGHGSVRSRARIRLNAAPSCSRLTPNTKIEISIAILFLLSIFFIELVVPYRGHLGGWMSLSTLPRHGLGEPHRPIAI